MIELPDDQTDKLFQEGAELFDFTYNPEAWKGMEEMLDAEEKRRRKWPFILVFLFSLSLVGIFVGVFLTNSTSSEQSVVAIESSKDALIENTNSLDIDPMNAGNDLTKNTTLEVSASNTDALNAEEAPVSSDSEMAKVDASIPSNKVEGTVVSTLGNFNAVSIEQNPELSGGQKRTDNVSSIKQASAIEEVGQRPALNTQAIDEGTMQPNDVTSSGNLVNTKLSNPLVNAKESRSDEDAGIDNVKATLSSLPLVAMQKVETTDLLDGAALPSLGDNGFSAEDKVAGGTFLSNFSVRAHGGVVYGVTDENGVGMPRSRYGLGLGYAVNNRLILGSGVTLNDLCYITDGANYRTKSTGWFGGASPSRIQALCKVLEIPFEMTYHFKETRSSGLYFRGGLLNYVMLSEKYDFSYDDSEIPPGVNVANLRSGWKEQNTNQHFLGMTQVSLGYQFALSPKTQLQVEGYIHAPLSGIGHGDVKVWSFGLNSSVNLNFK